MVLPVNIAIFTTNLPWEVTIWGWTGDEFECSFIRAAQKYYGSMEAAQYTMSGPDPAFDADFTIIVSRASFNFEPASFLDDLVEEIARAIVRAQVNPFVVADKPADVPAPIGIGFPLTGDVVDYLNNGGATIPIPLGLFAAFRLLPISEYTGVTEIVAEYRGTFA